jgi:membrane-associated protein
MITDILQALLHVDTYLATLISEYGAAIYTILFIIIFIETGLVVMPFLPGDSLLFIAGAFAAAGSLNILNLVLLLIIAAILGDAVNYWLGKYVGEKVFSRWIKHEHIEKTKQFFDQKGKKTIILARFVPIIRTFAPFVAGISKMHYRTFAMYNIAGGILWVSSMTFAGFFFGNISFVREHITFITLGIIVLSLIPAIIEYLKVRKN